MRVDARTRRAVLAGAAAALGAAGAALLWRSRERDPERWAQEIGATQGIHVAFGDPSTFYTPPYRPEDAKVPYVEMTAAEPAAYSSALKGIEASLAQYPSGFVGKLISAIFVCGRMTIEGAPAGGTYGPAWVLLSAPLEIGAAGIALTCRMGVHHELSSFVYMRGDLARDWADAEPPDWNFSASSAQQLGDDAAAPPPAETGFLSAYGATSSENDFNVYVEKMMTEMETVMGLARRHAVVARKAELVRRSYAAIDPRMDGVFRRFGMSAA
jgi:hypothetical protein